MKITNHSGLPEALVRYLDRDPYTRGEGVRFSVTQLIDAPQVQVLRRRHDHEMERDVSDMVFAIAGRAIHKFLEDSAAEHGDPDHTIEERIATTIAGVRISGQMDVQARDDRREIEIIDWKFTSVFAVMYGGESWEKQLNSYAFLHRTKYPDSKITGLTIVALLRDWRRADAEKNPEYPQTPIVRVPVPIWKPGEAEAYIRSRVNLHASASSQLAWGEEVSPCTDEERWWREGKWMVERLAQATKAKPERNWYTLKLVDSEAEARRIMATEKGEMRISRRRSPPVRCQGDYCGVAQWCPQWAAERAAHEKGGQA